MSARFPCPQCGHSITDQDAAGYRILGPGEWDKETVEKCAEELEKPHKFIDGTEVALPSALACAAAIRALAKEKQP